MDLSVIIVNWNSRDCLERCLQTLFSNSSGIVLEVIVVDNASFDGADRMLKESFPVVRFVQAEQNLGFARANNLGFHHATGRTLLFLNPDTEVRPDALAKMLAVFSVRADAGIAGARLLNADDTLQTSCVQSFPTILNQMLDCEFLRARFPKSRLWGTRALYLEAGVPAAVEAVSGACLMIRRDLFAQVGQFTSDYFMYSEDIDLCLKARQAGWKTFYQPDAVVVHHGGRSSGWKSEGKFAPVMSRESLLKFMRLRRGAVYARLYQMSVGLIAICRMGLLGAMFLLSAGAIRRQSLSDAFSKWTHILRWALGLETWVDKHA